ncbi:hypothetical protein BJX70DRAFT_397531 [Aspergillus crustosus]
MASPTSKGDASLKKTNKYKGYLMVRKFEIKVRGGDSGKHADLNSAPNDPANFFAWSQSITDSTANDSVKRKGLVTKLNKPLSFFNSFRLSQGMMYMSPVDEDGNAEISFHGPPGMKVYCSSQNSNLAKANGIAPVRWKLTITNKKWKDEVREGYTRISAPPLPVKVNVQNSVEKPQRQRIFSLVIFAIDADESEVKPSWKGVGQALLDWWRQVIPLFTTSGWDESLSPSSPKELGEDF